MTLLEQAGILAGAADARAPPQRLEQEVRLLVSVYSHGRCGPSRYSPEEMVAVLLARHALWEPDQIEISTDAAGDGYTITQGGARVSVRSLAPQGQRFPRYEGVVLSAEFDESGAMIAHRCVHALASLYSAPPSPGEYLPRSMGGKQ